MATDIDQADEETQNLLRKWGRLHAVRSGLGAIATVLFIFAL